MAYSLPCTATSNKSRQRTSLHDPRITGIGITQATALEEFAAVASGHFQYLRPHKLIEQMLHLLNFTVRGTIAFTTVDVENTKFLLTRLRDGAKRVATSEHMHYF